MADTENNKTWITSKSIAIAARIPHHLHDRIEAYGMATYPKGENSYDKTQTLIDLISKGLDLDGSVTQNVIQSVNHLDVTQSVIHDVKQDILESVMQSVKQDVLQRDNDLTGKLEAAIAASPIIEELRERLKKLEGEGINQLTQPIPPIPLNTLESDNNSIAVLKHTNILPSEDCQEDGLETINDETPLNDSEAVVTMPNESKEKRGTSVRGAKQKNSSMLRLAVREQDFRTAIGELSQLTCDQRRLVGQKINFLSGEVIFENPRNAKNTYLVPLIASEMKENPERTCEAIRMVLGEGENYDEN